MKINKNSIFFNITIIFLISLFFIAITFYIVIKNSENIHKNFLKRRYAKIAAFVVDDIYKNKGKISKKLQQRLEDLDLKLVKTKRSRSDEYHHMNHICNLKMPKYRVRVFEKKGNYYIFVKTHNFRIILKDEASEVNNSRYLAIMIIVITIILLLSYISIIRKLYPLKILQKKIRRLGEGKFDIEYKIEGEDEIAILSKEFDKSLKNLKNIKNSRDIFLRNIMHELKTPITKGRFLTKLPCNEENINKMEKLFLRLEILISEFATIEEMISSAKITDKKEFYLIDIVDNALDILFEDDKRVDMVVKNDQIKVKANFKLLSIAIKNLLDNGIKYSSDGKVKLVLEDKKIVVKNRGDKLKYPLERYFEPFFKDDGMDGSSFGLGLYIVHHILLSHNMALKYDYQDGINIFSIEIL